MIDVDNIKRAMMICEGVGGKLIPLTKDNFLCKTEKFLFGKLADRFVFIVGNITIHSNYRPIVIHKSEDTTLITSGNVAVSIVPENNVFVTKGDLIVKYSLETGQSSDVKFQRSVTASPNNIHQPIKETI